MKKNFTSNIFSRLKSLETYMIATVLGLSLTTSAQTTNSNNNPFSKINGTEDVSKRDLYSRHFLTENGTTAVIGTSVINYEKDGAFNEINTAIKSSNDNLYPYANTENMMETHFGATALSGIKSTTNDGIVIEFLNGKQYWETNGQTSSLKQAANAAVSVANNKATYSNIFPGVNAEFTVLNGKRKLNYVISSATTLANAPANADFLVFSEDIKIPATWTHSTTEDGIYLMDSKNTRIYLYENPNSVDSGRNSLRHSNTIMSAFRTGNTLTVLTKVKTNWLLSTDRIFPVLIDPTATVYPDLATMNTGFVFSSDNFKQNNLIAFGRDVDNGALEDFMRGWAKFNTTSIPDDVTIDPGTTIYFNIEDGFPEYSPANGNSLVISQIPSNVDPVTATGATLLTTIEQAGYSPVITAAINTLGWKSHTITSAQIALDIKNQLPSNKFSVGFMPQGSFSPEVYLVASGWEAAEKPYLIVNYTVPVMGITDNTINVGVYPNPVQSELFIKTDATVQSVEVFSMLGQSVAKQTAQNSISVAHLSKGIYSIQITLEDGAVANQKFIKN